MLGQPAAGEARALTDGGPPSLLENHCTVKLDLEMSLQGLTTMGTQSPSSSSKESAHSPRVLGVNVRWRSPETPPSLMVRVTWGREDRADAEAAVIVGPRDDLELATARGPHPTHHVRLTESHGPEALPAAVVGALAPAFPRLDPEGHP